MDQISARLERRGHGWVLVLTPENVEALLRQTPTGEWLDMQKLAVSESPHTRVMARMTVDLFRE